MMVGYCGQCCSLQKKTVFHLSSPLIFSLFFSRSLLLYLLFMASYHFPRFSWYPPHDVQMVWHQNPFLALWEGSFLECFLDLPCFPFPSLSSPLSSLIRFLSFPSSFLSLSPLLSCFIVFILSDVWFNSIVFNVRIIPPLSLFHVNLSAGSKSTCYWQTANSMSNLRKLVGNIVIRVS